MRDKFIFSNSQTLTDTDSTGEISDNIWDLEEDAVTDGQLMGWLNFHFISAVVANLTEGLVVELRSSDAAALATTPLYCGALQLGPTEVAAGAKFCFGFVRSSLKKYAGVWYRAVSTANIGAIVVESYFSEQPIGPILGLQKKPS